MISLLDPQIKLIQKISAVSDAPVDGFSEAGEERKEELLKWSRTCAKLLSCLRDATQRAINSGQLPPDALYKHHKSGQTPRGTFWDWRLRDCTIAHVQVLYVTVHVHVGTCSYVQDSVCMS